MGKKVALLFPPLCFLAFALGDGNYGELFSGFLAILRHPGILITDYFAIAGIPATLFNVGLVGCVGWMLFLLAPTITGSHIAALLTLMGFAFFGKNPLNILPVILGCALFAWVFRESFRNILPASLFATSLAPVASFLFCHWGFRFELAFLFGVLGGFLTMAIAQRVATFHSGYNLYNIGFSGGIVGLLLAALLEGFGFEIEPTLAWQEDVPPAVPLVLSAGLSSLLLLGVLGNRQVVAHWRSILGFSGRPPADFFASFPAATLWNMGMVGLLGVAYVLLVGGSCNGPVLGGILTMVGFAACGKHLRNVFPLLSGVYLGTLCSPFEASEPGPLLAALFSSALAPVAGELGVLAGVLAGFLHLFVVMSVGVLHGGLNLYNNGFAAGFVAVVVASLFRYPLFRKRTG
ncbi:MAG: DUF1576 domain-containing protein [Candidatus Caldatribacterium sp.]|uniref:DUF1576 domain-containing protein n=1 Tax=Candidatus Caldatribacterium sp. TaxID=2282143 RepID=UPI0029972245|nr:DUF1576 domain-containing protein [Candidatus Caldatribacterium sp.]MCX7731534.1 DUF1576 domain-containing protein [Candidatus Caldatribacterium sp.]MDW8081058.1 DUF1576 domain-containing protein [Candidatus Calescibacterium sp.]